MRESSAPFTLTMGPQLIIPTGSFARGTGFNAVGYAWDVAAAKDWGGPVFLYSSLNYALFAAVRDPVPGPTRSFNLQNLFWTAALGLRPLEKDRGASHHDIHVFLEYGLGREDSLEQASPATKVPETLSVLAPGLRYGFLTRSKKLFEVGVSFPVGLNQNTPQGGVILQIQFEQSLAARRKEPCPAGSTRGWQPAGGARPAE